MKWPACINICKCLQRQAPVLFFLPEAISQAPALQSNRAKDPNGQTLIDFIGHFFNHQL